MMPYFLNCSLLLLVGNAVGGLSPAGLVASLTAQPGAAGAALRATGSGEVPQRRGAGEQVQAHVHASTKEACGHVQEGEHHNS